MNTAYDILTAIPLSLLLLLLFGSNANIPEDSIWGYILCPAISAVLGFLRNRKPRTRLRCIGIAAVFLIGLVLAAGEENRQLFFEEDLWILWIVGFAAAALLIGILMDLNIWIRRAVAAGLVMYCIIGTVYGFEIRKETFALISFLLLIRLAEEIQQHWEKSGFPERKAHITSIAPFFLVICLTIYLVPAPDQPYNWQFVKDICQKTVLLADRVYGSLTHPKEEYSNIGFSDEGGFAAGLGTGEEEVMLIQVSNPMIRNYELVGCISNDFRGREWVFNTEEERTVRMMDTMETVCAVRKYADSFQSDYLQKVDLQYEMRLYNTQYVFSPAKIKLEATKEQTAGISDKNGSIISKKKLQYKDEYKVLCYMLNYGNPDLGVFLDNAEPISETEWRRAAEAEKVLNKPGYSYADYQNYRKSVYDTYCHTYGVSDDVQALLDDIRSRSTSRYEALKLLESYFQQMDYSTDCGALPDSVTDAAGYLDYFLFTSRKGYCMHFATAFTLMANELGIPCRYVQGYSVQKGSDGNILVLQSNAHAWPEAYFDNAGWVAFEPTPGYSVQTGWERMERKPYNFEQYVPAAEQVTEPAEQTDPDAEKARPLDPQILIIPALAAAGFLLLLLVSSRLLSRMRYRRKSREDKLRYLMQQDLRLLGYLGFRRAPDETLSEYRARIEQSGRQDIREQLGFLAVYEGMVYGDSTVTEAAIRSAEQTDRELRRLVKRSKLRYRVLLLFSR